jgi:hypothetical protein
MVGRHKDVFQMKFYHPKDLGSVEIHTATTQVARYASPLSQEVGILFLFISDVGNALLICR